MQTLKDRIWSEYPIPQTLSTWGGDDLERQEEFNLDSLIETCLEELGSDIFLTEYKQATGMITHMPKGTITCTSAKLSGQYPFQGNRIVKVTYDASNRQAYLRYYPATITYRRQVTIEDVDNGKLIGDRLRFVMFYIMWKMGRKELNTLKTANMNVDNGAIDLSVLDEFQKECQESYKTLKEEILIYSTVN